MQSRKKMIRRISSVVVLNLFILGNGLARPPGPGVICSVFPDAAQCAMGQPSCTTCHTTPPGRNAFGRSIEAAFPAEINTDAEFESALPPILMALASEDADEDGFTNEAELIAGTSPGNAEERPSVGGCDGESINPVWDVCAYDTLYTFRKVSLDVCGVSPTYDDMAAFKALFPAAQKEAIAEKLATCLDTKFWQGRDGVLWRMAHSKIRPISAIKSGVNGGPVPLGDYDDDYRLFVYTQIDDQDARDVITADYYVNVSGNPPAYTRVAARPEQTTQPDRRAGMLTTRYFSVVNTMFTAVPRTTAAQAYRAYLGLDISRSEGLIPPDNAVLVDYDDKGITEPECAVCHTTLDPLTYPFSRYHGIFGGGTANYDVNRMNFFDPASEGARVRELPEAGHLFGEPVADLLEWADVAANSEQFARAIVTEYWVYFLGHKPTVAEAEEFESVWRAFMNEHEYRVERMLLSLIGTEAYGVP